MGRRTASLAMFAASFVGCGGSDPPPLFADMQWQVQCRVMGGCSGIPQRSINHLDGEEGHEIECSATRAGAERIVTFSGYGRGFGLEVRSARFNPAGSSVLGQALVRVEEGGNRFEGYAGGTTPSDDQPCRLGNMRVSNEPDGVTLFAELLCVNIPSPAARTLRREVTFPGAVYGPDGAHAAPPATIRIVNCPGL
ncbi:MAG: hypothetical protein NZ898_14395 [Myxococcota bacterium]|nr:hypothetical protein [Myxococcota bacterium]MDW8360845.1 hypothetical protein [Myxococcales bacterium]